MTETPSLYGPPRKAVKIVAGELAAIANMLHCLSEKMPTRCERDVLIFLAEQTADCLHNLREAIERCRNQPG